MASIAMSLIKKKLLLVVPLRTKKYIFVRLMDDNDITYELIV
jgi:hypothetical protein